MMDTAKQRSTLASLEAQRRALLHALTHVDKQIGRSEQAQARLEERIRILEQGQRQAA